MADACPPHDELSPLEREIWAAAYVRTVYPLHHSESDTAMQAVVDSAASYADRIVEQYRRVMSLRGGR